MTGTQHPLTETTAAELWDTRKAVGTLTWADMKQHHPVDSAGLLSVLRAVFDAGRDHERAQTQTRPTEVAEITDEMVEAAAQEVYAHDAPSNDPQTWPPTPDGLADDYRGTARAALSAALTVDTHPWEPLAPRDPLHKGDEVRVDAGDFVIIATVARVDEGGYAYTAGGALIDNCNSGTWHVRRHTPAAEEVEMPSEFGAVITNVDTVQGGHFTRMARTGPEHFTQGPNSLELRHIDAFTLPDGTRARRDGKTKDSEPRFVKASDEEDEK